MSVPALRIEATGMCCAVGTSTEMASAAIRAGLDHFRESWFLGPGGKPLSCAMLWDVDVWGPPRMGLLFASVLAECREQAPWLQPEETCLMLLVPEPDRPGGNDGWPQALYAACTASASFHATSQICPWGRAGLGPSLLYARDVLARGAVRQVLLAGVDSYLTSAAIESYLARERLLTDEISDGFIPGEGAGAVVLRLDVPGKPGTRITGVGMAEEPAHILQEALPNRADGLVRAIRAAVAECGHELAETDFHMSDGNGNSFYLREAAVALVRTFERPVHNAAYPHKLISSSIGETGAAVGPLLLAFLTRLLPREDGPGRSALLHFSADNGKRAAVIVDHRSA